MATSSIDDHVVIKDDATFDRLLEILNKPSRFDDIKPITPEEEQEGREAFERCLLRHSKQK